MKKIFRLFLVATILISCSNNTDTDIVTQDPDPNPDPVNTSKKPKTIQFGGANVAFDLVTFNYDSNGKLVSLDDPTLNYVQEYFYTGDRVTEIRNLNNNTLSSKTTYEYANNLVSIQREYNSDNELTRTRTYSYDSDNRVQSYTDDNVDPNLTDWIWDYQYDTTGNSVTRTNTNDTSMYSITIYDNKKTPQYNLSFRRILDRAIGNINSNNIIETVSYFNGSVNNITNYENTYDNDDFLVSTNVNSSSGSSRTETYTYDE